MINQSKGFANPESERTSIQKKKKKTLSKMAIHYLNFESKKLSQGVSVD